MGLDMYLDRVKRLPNLSIEEVRELDNILYFKKDNYEEILEKYKDFVVEKENYDKSKYYTFVESGIYWRKSNHIHNWFVENIQGGEDECNAFEVFIEDLEELRDLCEKVIEDNSLVEELLPTQSGFFFGGTDYDEYYFEDLKDTVENIDNLLKSYDVEKEFLTYCSSW